MWGPPFMVVDNFNTGLKRIIWAAGLHTVVYITLHHWKKYSTVNPRNLSTHVLRTHWNIYAHVCMCVFRMILLLRKQNMTQNWRLICRFWWTQENTVTTAAMATHCICAWVCVCVLPFNDVEQTSCGGWFDDCSTKLQAASAKGGRQRTQTYRKHTQCKSQSSAAARKTLARTILFYCYYYFPMLVEIYIFRNSGDTYLPATWAARRHTGTHTIVNQHWRLNKVQWERGEDKERGAVMVADDLHASLLVLWHRQSCLVRLSVALREFAARWRTAERWVARLSWPLIS